MSGSKENFLRTIVQTVKQCKKPHSDIKAVQVDHQNDRMRLWKLKNFFWIKYEHYEFTRL